MFDLAAARAETPGCARVAHLNNAGASLPIRATLERITAHLGREAEIGGYEAAAEVADEIDGVRASLAGLIGADPAEIALVGSDTQAFAKLLWGWAVGGGLPRGGLVMVDRLNYNSHYLALLQLRRAWDIRIELAPSAADGSVQLDAFAARLRRGDVDLFSGTHLGTHSGTLNDATALGRCCAAEGVTYFLDACQSLGQLPVDVGAIGCHALTGTGRKWLRGPRGTGVLFVREEVAARCDPPGIDGVAATWSGPDRYALASGAARFEEFEVPLAARLGLGVAVDYARSLGLDSIAARIGLLASQLRAGLIASGADVHDGAGAGAGIVTFTVPGRSPAAVVAAAATAGININASAAHHARLDMDAKDLAEVVRASPHYFNSEAEIDRLVAVVAGH